MNWVTSDIASTNRSVRWCSKAAVFSVFGVKPFAGCRWSISIVCVCHKSVYKSGGHFRGISLTLLASGTRKCNGVLFQTVERSTKGRKRTKAFRKAEQNFSRLWTHKASQWRLASSPLRCFPFLHGLVKGHSEKWALMTEIFLCMGQRISCFFSAFAFLRSLRRKRVYL